MSSPATPRHCCPEYAVLSRRGFLGATALAGTATVLGSAVVTAAAAPLAPAPAGAVLVVLSLRGAADGLSLVVPHGDPVYYQARPSIAVPAESLVAKDAFFGLHPQLSPLLPLWQDGRLAAVHATGLPAPNRSHFSAMEEVEDADPGSSARVGWLNRLIGLDQRETPLQGFALGSAVPPTSLQGPESFVSAGSAEDMTIAGDDQWDEGGRRLASLHRLWDDARHPLAGAMGSAFRAVEDFAPVREGYATPAHGATYPTGDLGRAMREAARIVRGDVGVEVITVDQGDWDHHVHLGNVEQGRLRTNAAELGQAVAAFFTDIGGLASKVTLVTISEFGRRVRQNANQGTDHGYGNVMFLAGAGVRGGKYHGTWPGLTNQLDSDLLVTTDYRSVLSEVVTTRFGRSTATVFPGFSPESVGVMTSL